MQGEFWLCAVHGPSLFWEEGEEGCVGPRGGTGRAEVSQQGAGQPGAEPRLLAPLQARLLGHGAGILLSLLDCYFLNKAPNEMFWLAIITELPAFLFCFSSLQS